MIESTGLNLGPPPDLAELERAADVILKIHGSTLGETSNSDEMVLLELDCLRSLGVIVRTLGTLGVTEVYLSKETTKDED